MVSAQQLRGLLNKHCLITVNDFDKHQELTCNPFDAQIVDARIQEGAEVVDLSTIHFSSRASTDARPTNRQVITLPVASIRDVEEVTEA